MSQPTVLSVASEYFPLVKTGGLADVAGALPAALAGEGVAMRTLIPGYAQVMAKLDGATPVHAYGDLFGGIARVLSTRVGGHEVLVLDAPHHFAREGDPYSQPDGLEWPDNAFRFAALARVAADAGLGVFGTAPDVVHLHDWQTGLTAAYLERAGTRRPAIVTTIHNIAYQGVFPASLLASLNLPQAMFAVDGLEFNGEIGFLKAGLYYADRITTVSPSYSGEIRTGEWGMGFEGLLRARAKALSGILNGVDTKVWNPATDGALAAKFDVRRLGQRPANKAALQARFGLVEEPDAPLFGVVSRLTWQKGLDLFAGAVPRLLAAGGQIVMLGSGERPLEADYTAMAAAAPSRFGLRLGYDEDLAHLIQGGADVIVVPSRFEPCGLTQLCALRYGAVPLVARVGGLADTIIDANEMAVAARVASGVQFSPVTSDALDGALHRTLALYRQPDVWTRLQTNGMKTDVSWKAPARRYADLYRSLVAARSDQDVAS